MKTLFWTVCTYLCSPFLLVAARLRSRSTVEKVLIIQLGKLGDMVATTPLFRAVKTTYPNAEVHVLCLKGSDAVLKGNPYVDNVHYYDALSRRQLIRRVRGQHFDWCINVLPGSFASVVGLWSLIPNRINTSSKNHGILIRILGVFNQYARPYLLGTHTFDHYMSLASFMDVQPISYHLDFYPGEEQGYIGARDGYVILSLTAGNAVKEWPVEKFVAVADYVTEKLDRDVLLSTLDQNVIADVRSKVVRSDRVFDGSHLSLAEFGNACIKAGAFISVDTGPMYLAYSMGCPVVVMIGPVDPREQMPPESDKVSYVLPPKGTHPWVHISQTPRTGTMAQLSAARDTSVEDVIAGLERVLR